MNRFCTTILRFARFIVLLSSASACTLHAQTEDRVASTLARARVKYESDMSTACNQVMLVLQRALDNAPKAEDPESARRLAKGALDAFRERGELPEDMSKPRWEQMYARAASDLVKAYVAASVAYTKAGDERRESAVNAESESFRTSWDFIPWREAPGKGTGDTQLASGGSLLVEVGEYIEYRLDVTASRLNGSGVLSIEMSLPGVGKAILFPIADSNGKYRVLLTVRSETVSLDLGVERPAKVDTGSVGEARAVILKAEGGSFTIEKVHLKPVIEGQPPSIEARVNRPTERAPEERRGPENPFQTGRKWSGYWEGNGCDIEVVEGGDSPAIRISRANGAAFRLEGTVRNGVFSLRTIKHVKVATGGSARFFTSQSGTVTVRDGHLFVNCTTRNHVGSIRNQRFDIVISNAEPR